MTVKGTIFEVGRSDPVPAALNVEETRQQAWLEVSGETVACDVGEVSDRVAGVARRVVLGDGRVFSTEDDDGVDQLLLALGRRRGSRVHLLEQPRLRIWLALVVLLGVAAWGLKSALPLVADGIASAVPQKLERSFGAAAFGALEQVALKPSTLSEDDQARVRNLFARLSAVSGRDPVLVLRSASALGANALAFPGGPVLVTDELVRIAPNDDALMSVLAHELAHVEERHGVRVLLRAFGWALLIGFVIGDDNSLLEEAGSFGTVLASNAYSRDFERAADARAVEIMTQVGADLSAFADMLRALQKSCGKACEQGDGSWWSTHPGTDERIRALGPD
ncbi:MAG: M48 family metallopeptidase [Rhodospirillaceae bacterium]|nr:M48 family metallopeptidase [Rhodospirillaceae bacterium]